MIRKPCTHEARSHMQICGLSFSELQKNVAHSTPSTVHTTDFFFLATIFRFRTRAPDPFSSTPVPFRLRRHAFNGCLHANRYVDSVIRSAFSTPPATAATGPFFVTAHHDSSWSKVWLRVERKFYAAVVVLGRARPEGALTIPSFVGAARHSSKVSVTLALA